MLMLSPLLKQAFKDYGVILSLARRWEQLPTPQPGAIAQAISAGTARVEGESSGAAS